MKLFLINCCINRPTFLLFPTWHYFLFISAASAPINVSATGISSTRITVSWSEPISLNGILHDYNIRYKLSSDVIYNNSVSAGTQLNHTIGNLRPYSAYDFEVSPFSLTLYNCYRLICSRKQARFCGIFSSPHGFIISLVIWMSLKFDIFLYFR